MRSNFRLNIALILVCGVGACAYKNAIPLEFPTPPAATSATPVGTLAIKRDAELEAKIADIAAAARGKVGVAAVVIETGEAALLKADQRFPMQSVYKLPISMAVIDQLRQEKLDLDEIVAVTKDDMVRAGMRSPLRDKSPIGGEFTIRELIRLAIVESDGTASDVLMRVAGGASEIQSFLTGIGIRDLKVVNTEKEIGRDWHTQYQNSATPLESVGLLTWLYMTASGEPNSDLIEHAVPAYMTIAMDMVRSKPGSMRLKRLLPKDTFMAHKTGTSGTQNGITAATNDIGIIWLPNGQHLAIAVYVSDSAADEKTREAVIAKIAKAVWDRWNRLS